MAHPLIKRLEQHHEQSWGWALACCDWQQAVAEDALQEAYLRVLDGRAKFSGNASEKTWFFAVIRRVAAEQRRALYRLGRIAALFSAEPQQPAAEDAPQMIELDQSNAKLRDALLALPQRQREILHLVFYSDLTLENAAISAGVSLGSARTHYHRGKQRLQTLLGDTSE